MNTIREQFEAWARTNMSLNRWGDTHSYTSSHTIAAWESWQAAFTLRSAQEHPEGAEQCDQCGAITARLNGDKGAKWCCHCGGKLTGNYVSTAAPKPEQQEATQCFHVQNHSCGCDPVYANADHLPDVGKMVQETPELTDDEIAKAMGWSCLEQLDAVTYDGIATSVMIKDIRAVITADRAKRGVK